MIRQYLKTFIGVIFYLAAWAGIISLILLTVFVSPWWAIPATLWLAISLTAGIEILKKGL